MEIIVLPPIKVKFCLHLVEKKCLKFEGNSQLIYQDYSVNYLLPH
jgi:hypothetical protein